VNRRRVTSALAMLSLVTGCSSSSREHTASVIAAATASGTYTYTFDAEGLSTSVGTTGASYAISRSGDTLTAGADVYRFDALGRTIAIDDLSIAYGPDGQIDHASRGSETVSYLYDEGGQRILKSSNGAPSVAYLEGAWVTPTELDEPIRAGAALVGLLRNGAFTPVAADTRGTAQADIDGTPRPSSPFGARGAHPDVASEIDYAGKGFDGDLGTDRMGVRDYDARLGRFLEPDPLFLLKPEKCVESPVECSLYGYARSNPASFTDPTGTWSSMWIPFIAEPVHQMAIDNVLRGVVSDRGLQILKETQTGVDELQRAEEQPLHAMNGEGQDRERSIAQANRYVAEKLTAAKDRFGSWSGYVLLGSAIHTLQDATSPSHEGFQTYHDHYPDDVFHSLLERHYPAAGTEDRKLLEGATRWAYDIAAGKAAMPDHFFDQRTGEFQLPDAYKNDGARK
jgi:RHS repeat-associated protein